MDVQKNWHISINDTCISKHKYLYFAVNNVATMMFHSDNQKQKRKNFKQVFTNERQK